MTNTVSSDRSSNKRGVVVLLAVVVVIVIAVTVVLASVFAPTETPAPVAPTVDTTSEFCAKQKPQQLQEQLMTMLANNDTDQANFRANLKPGSDAPDTIVADLQTVQDAFKALGEGQPHTGDVRTADLAAAGRVDTYAHDPSNCP